MAVKGLWNILGINIPDYGLTEKKTTWQSNPAAVQAYGAPSSYASSSNGLQSTPGGTNYSLGPNTVKTPGVLEASTSYGDGLKQAITPTTSGGAPTGGGPTPANNGGNQQDTSNASAALAAWQAERQGLLNQEPLLDQSYNQGKTDIQDTIDSATKTADAQKLQNSQDYGNLLRGNLQTYQDTNRSRQGIFSNLGTLDSSAFQEQQFRGDQNFGQNKGAIEGDQLKQDTNITNTLTDFTNKAKSGLSSLALQYQSGKNALSSAIAQGDIQGAQDVSNALTDIRQKAADINNAIIQFQDRANYYKSQGYNVNTTLPTFNSSSISPNVQNSFGQQLSNIKNMTPAAPTGPTGQGYIIDAQGNKRDPLTGAIVQ